MNGVVRLQQVGDTAAALGLELEKKTWQGKKCGFFISSFVVLITVRSRLTTLMNNTSAKIIVGSLIALLFTSSCGGVIGNIEQYDFPNVRMDSLINAVEKVYAQNPALQMNEERYAKTETKGEFARNIEYYLKCTQDENLYVLAFSVIGNLDTNRVESTLSLSTGAEYGHNLYLAKNIGFLKKRKYRKLFEENMVNAVRKELNASR